MLHPIVRTGQEQLEFLRSQAKQLDGKKQRFDVRRNYDAFFKTILSTELIDMFIRPPHFKTLPNSFPGGHT